MPHHNKHAQKLESPTGKEPVNPQTQRNLQTAESQNVVGGRAKNSGHGKKTADKWNQ